MLRSSNPYQQSTGRSVARHLSDLLVCLVIAVVIVRSFQIEGYMISTGSMAPGLLGYHKQVVCPSCDWKFEIGLAFDDSILLSDGRVRQGEQLCTCPNCGQPGIDVSSVPRNQGDQLLVNKGAFLFRQPDRFEPIVFRNPAKPSQAYVKRVGGLPGERIQIIDGDVLINDQLVRKSFARQLNMRIPVYSTNFQRKTPSLPGSRWATGEGWEAKGAGFNFVPSNTSVGWLEYVHVIPANGVHESSVDVSEAEIHAWTRFQSEFAEFPMAAADQIHIDDVNRKLISLGFIHDNLRDLLLQVSESAEWKQKVEALTRESRIGPVNDFYGYNKSGSGKDVRDLMLSIQVRNIEKNAVFVVQAQTDLRKYSVRLDAAKETLELRIAGVDQPVQLAKVQVSGREFLLEISTFDRQLMVAIDETPVFDAVYEPSDLAPQKLSARPFRLGATAAAVQIDHVSIYRDVYYTKGRARNGISSPYQLGSDEYFMLGDNSPVSSDSRSWPNGAVNERLLVGKPFVVHLPSRPGKIGVGRKWRYIRLPNWSRIRFVK